MASRSLTDVFLLMRNNAIRSRHIYPDQDASERMHLVSLTDLEEGLHAQHASSMPPAWIDYLEKAQRVLPKLRAKIGELQRLHARLLHRPAFDEGGADEAAVEASTRDISRMFTEVHRLLQVVRGHAGDGPPQERRLTHSACHALAAALQELSTLFRGTQGGYLRQVQSREDRARVFFEEPTDERLDEIDDHFVNSRLMSQQQLLVLEEENARFAEEREQEVNVIVKSIVDLNEIFKDLSQMVADQGTVLDRIDYNVEQTQIQVFEGFKQLQKADAYQRKNRKMCIIIVLAVIIIFLFFLLVIVKS